MKNRLKAREALKKVSGKLPWKKVFVYGPEDYLTEQFIKKVSAVKAVRKFYPDGLEELFAFSGTSLFGSSPIPVIVHAEELPKFLRKKEDKEKFFRKIKELNEFIVACYCDLDFKTLKKEPFCWLLEVCDVVVYSDYLSEGEAKKLIVKKLFQRGISEDVVDFVIEKVGLNLRELRNETEKLLLYPGEINLEVAEGLISFGGRVNVFDLIFKLVSCDREGYLEGIDRVLREGTEPLQVLALFQSQVRQMINLVLGREVKLPKNVQQRLKASASKVGLKRLLKVLKFLNEAEFSIKTGAVEGEGALKSLVFRCGG